MASGAVDPLSNVARRCVLISGGFCTRSGRAPSDLWSVNVLEAGCASRPPATEYAPVEPDEHERMNEVSHQGLPVAGYQAQSTEKVDLVSDNKVMEERLLRAIDEIRSLHYDEVDIGWLDDGRRLIEQGFMCVNRAIFQPSRLVLPEDIVKHAKEVGCEVSQIEMENEADRHLMARYGVHVKAPEGQTS